MKFSRPLCVVILALASSLVAQSSPSQPQPSSHRSRVALALSGGGSLGLAHVGVLKYFEEHHIPVDAIAGTSMGGIVGGLYATGHTPWEIEQSFNEEGWEEVIRTQADYTDLPIGARQDRAHYPGGYALRLGRGLSLPAGLATAESFDLFLSRQVLAYSTVQEFANLPTPFRCVATQLQTGKPMVLQRGNLARAMRATMSIPGIFTPVEWEGHVLVDGGLVDNLPTDVARDMGADIVIGVHFSLGVPPKGQLQSLTNVLTQAVSVAVSDTERENLRNADLILAPSLVGIGGTDYSHVHELVERGYQAARQKSGFLATLALNDADWATYLAERQSRMKPTAPQPSSVIARSADPTLAHHAQTELNRSVPVISLLQLEHELSTLVAGSALPAAFYRLSNPADLPGNGASSSASPQPSKVVAEIDPRPGSLLIMRPSLQSAVANGEPTRGALLAFATILPQDRYLTRYHIKAVIGYSPQVAADYESPLGSTHWFWSPSLNLRRLNSATYSGNQHFTHWQDTYSGAVDLGFGMGPRFRVRAGVEAGYDRPSNIVFPGALTTSAGAMLAPRLLVDWNTLDDGSLPTRGNLLTASMTARYRQADARTVPLGQASFEQNLPLAAGVVTARLMAASSFGTRLNYFDLFPLGGSADLRAFRFGQFHAASYAMGELAYRRPLSGIKLLGQRPHWGAWYDVAGLTQPMQSWQSAQSGSLGVLFNSPLGVITLAVGRTGDGQTRGSINVGRP